MIALIIGILVAEIIFAICVVLLSDLLERLRLQQLQIKCERDIPKKVKSVVRNMIHEGFETGECPTCGRFIVNVANWSNDKLSCNYCENCGQRLDWNKEKLGKKIQKVFIDENP